MEIVTKEDLQTIIFNAVNQAFDANFRSAIRGPEYQYKSVLTPDETAAFLGITKGSLYQMTAFKKIPFTKAGKHLRFSKVDLEKWLQARKSHSKIAV